MSTFAQNIPLYAPEYSMDHRNIKSGLTKKEYEKALLTMNPNYIFFIQHNIPLYNKFIHTFYSMLCSISHSVWPS